MRQHVKQILSLVPPVGRYLAEKNELDAALRVADASRNLLRQERDELAQTVHWLRDVVLGKLSILETDCGSFRRDVNRLSGNPPGGMNEQLLRYFYLDLLESALIGKTLEDESVVENDYDGTRRDIGRDWPRFALTMIGRARMRSLRELVERVLLDDVAGDFLEAGVWRGGACIYMRGILKAYGIEDRRVWVADSFAGHPPPNVQRYPADRHDIHGNHLRTLAVSLDQVQANFSKYGLLDEQVRFLHGWFKDVLPQASVRSLALLRLDGDMYESTMQTLDALYWKVSPRGFVIVDDYCLPPCREAVEDFRSAHGIGSPLEEVDGAAVYWRKRPNEHPRVDGHSAVRQGHAQEAH